MGKARGFRTKEVSFMGLGVGNAQLLDTKVMDHTWVGAGKWYVKMSSFTQNVRWCPIKKSMDRLRNKMGST